MVGNRRKDYRPRRALPEDDDRSTDRPAGRRDGSPSQPRTAASRRWGRPSALVVGVVTAVVLLGLAVGYAVRSNNPPDPPKVAAPQSPTPVASPAVPTPSLSEAGVLLGDDSMLTAAQAAHIDTLRHWTVTLTQKGLDADSPQPACLDDEPMEGDPAPQQTVLRLLSGSGSAAPAILHQAIAYQTAEEAAQSYALASRALGGCTRAATSIHSGQLITGLGDQSVGVVLKVADGAVPEYRRVILSRTGRILNVVDLAREARVPAATGMLAALAEVTASQCKTSGGKCAPTPRLRDGPPPIGGDQPGFLAAGDLPPVGQPQRTWGGDTPGEPSPDFTGSGCETTRFDKVQGSGRARTYLLDATAGVFGVDEIVLTMNSRKEAAKLVADLKADIRTCPSRKVTAVVSPRTDVKGVGTNGANIVGWTASVTQSTSATAKNKFRVGATTTGSKVVYVFLSADLGRKLDLTTEEWNRVTVRAGQRATQVK